MKPFKSIDEQILLLKQRGMIFLDEEKARDLLFRSNYYDLVNGYSKVLKEQGQENYITGTTFEDLYSIYSFDKNIKSVFFRKILKVEAYMRSSIAYIFSESHPENYAYLNITNFEGNPLKIAKFLAKLSQIIKFNNKERSAINHYINNHNNVPLWVLINYFSFGQLVEFFGYMKQSERNKIAKNIGDFMNENYNFQNRFSAEQIYSFLVNINEVRNIVAHDDRLICYTCVKNVKYHSDVFSHDGISERDGRKSVYCTLLTMKCFLTVGQYGNFVSALKSRINDLDKKFKKSECSITVNEVLRDFGLPTDWHLS